MTISIIYGAETRGAVYQIYEKLTSELMVCNKKLHLIDLGDSRLTFELPYGYATKRNEQIIELQRKIAESDQLIFIYPVYWMNVPYKLKGFIDNIFWTKVSFDMASKQYLRNGLWKGKKATIIYTLGGAESWHRLNSRTAVKAMTYPLRVAGIRSIKTYCIDNMNRSSMDDNRFKRKLDKLVTKVLRRII